MESGLYISIGAYFVLMLGIGVYSYLNTEKDVSGFMLGGRQLGPAVTALSAGASDMSGWMLMGLPGLIYSSGISGAWIVVGLTNGAYLNYRLLAPRLRVYTEYLNDAVTIPEYLERRFADNSHLLRILCAVVIILFFAIYTTSGVVAGGKLFESVFGIQYEFGLYLTAGVVVAYSTFGGFMAVSTTDFVQGCIMLIALILVPYAAFTSTGGFDAVYTELAQMPVDMLNFDNISVLAAISALSWGLGCFGQPHIIVRFMAIRSVKDLVTARHIGMTWMILSVLGAILVGLIGAAYISATDSQLNDPETIFIVLANALFNPLLAGFLLAAILAAIMSTISSQLLVASSSITEDVYHTFLRPSASQKERLLVGRGSVVGVAVLAVVLAHDRNSSILSLVSNAWAGFGSAFGPVILLSLFWSRMTRAGALAGMASGTLTVVFWLVAPLQIAGQSLSSFVYELVPGFIVATAVTVVVSLMTKVDKSLVETHQGMELELQRQLRD
ncbi:MAG: sodium/proline symporter PutP [Arenicella sp.]|nr:sodium/proline symporter PutP [Arenicella sp.]